MVGRVVLEIEVVVDADTDDVDVDNELALAKVVEGTKTEDVELADNEMALAAGSDEAEPEDVGAEDNVVGSDTDGADDLGIAADAAFNVVVDGAVAALVATITQLVSVSGAWLEAAWMMVVVARLLAMAVLASTARLMLVVVAAVIVVVLELAVAAARLESSVLEMLPLAVLDMKAMDTEIAASFASRFSAALTFLSN